MYFHNNIILLLKNSVTLRNRVFISKRVSGEILMRIQNFPHKTQFVHLCWNHWRIYAIAVIWFIIN